MGSATGLLSQHVKSIYPSRPVCHFLNPVIRFYMLQYVALRNLVRIRLCRWIMRVVARGHDCLRESHFAAAVGPIKLCLPIAQTIAVQYLQ